VGSTVRVSVEGGQVGEHFIEDAGVGGLCCLGVEVDGPCSLAQHIGLVDERYR
jgi:hypothetical protein